MISYIQYNVFKPKIFQPINVTVQKRKYFRIFKVSHLIMVMVLFDAAYYKEIHFIRMSRNSAI